MINQNFFLLVLRSMCHSRLPCSIQYRLPSSGQRSTVCLSYLFQYSKACLRNGWCTGPKRVSYETTSLSGRFAGCCCKAGTMWYVNSGNLRLSFLAPICNTVEPPVSNHPKNVKTRWLLTGGGRLREFRPLWVKT